MSQCQAVRTGFAASFNRPTVFLAEIAWRWAFAAAAWVVVLYGALLFMRSVPVSDRDALALSGLIPGSVAAAIKHIFTGSGPKMLRLLLAMVGGLGSLSWVASSLGRAAVLRELIPSADAANFPGRGIYVLLRLNFLRTLFAVLAFLAYTGCAFLVARSLLPEDPSRPVSRMQDAELLFFALAFAMSWIWTKINRRLVLAGMVSLCTGSGVKDSILLATALSFRRIRQFAWVGLVFGAIRIVLLVGTFFFALTAFGIFGQYSSMLGALSAFAVVLGYSVVWNFFRVGSLAAELRVIEWDAEISRGA